MPPLPDTLADTVAETTEQPPAQNSPPPGGDSPQSSAKPLKVLQLNMHNEWGGQPNRILTETRGLIARGHEVWVGGPRGCVLCERAKAVGATPYEELELRRGFWPRSIFRDVGHLKALIRAERFDIVHTHGSQDTWVAAVALSGPGSAADPHPAFIRSRHNTFRVATHLANRWLYRKIDWVITIAPQVDHLLTDDGLFDADRITAVYSAPDPERFSPRAGSDELRKELGIPEGVPVVGMVGRLAPEKGHSILIRAARDIVKKFPETRFLLVGKGRARDEIENLIAAAGLEKNFVLTGFRTDVPDLVALMDVFTLTPISGESLGTSILEGFCMEKPAVATQVGGTGESVRDDETGYLITPGPEAEQARQVGEAITRLLGDAELRDRMGKAGRAMVLREFSPEMVAERTEQVYVAALNSIRRSG